MPGTCSSPEFHLDSPEALIERLPLAIAVFDRELRLLRSNQAWEALAAPRHHERSKAALDIRGRQQDHLELEEIHGIYASMMSCVESVLAGETIRLEALRIENGSGVAFWDLELSPLARDRRVVGFIATATDVTTKMLAYQALEKRLAARTGEMERRRQVAESLGEILDVLNSSRPLADVLELIVAKAGELLGAGAVAIYRLQEDGMLRIQAAHGLVPKYVAHMYVPFGQGGVGKAVLLRQPVALPDIATDPYEPGVVSHEPPERRWCLEWLVGNYRSLVAVPLMARDDVYGGIVLHYSEPREFSDEDMQLAFAFGNQAALAIENARLLAEAKGKATLEERQRLARELHDSVTQSVYSMALLAEVGLRHCRGGDSARAEEYLTRLTDITQQTLKEMRLPVHELRPLELERGGLVGALQQRLDAVEKRAALATRLLVEGAVDDLPAALEQGFYRIVQEALNNALRHAGATAVTVRVRASERCLEAEVKDNGVGFDPKALPDRGGMGLASMRQRAVCLDGVLEIISSPGQGTTVRISAPLRTSMPLYPKLELC